MRSFNSFIFLLFPVLAWCMYLPHKQDDDKKSKRLYKEFHINPNGVVHLVNKFGSMHITTHDSDLVSIEIITTVTGPDDEQVADRLDDVKINVTHTDNMVKATTQIDKKSGGWWASLFSSKQKTQLQVDYKVSIPENTNLNAQNDYGDLHISSLKGKAILQSDYGSIQADSLLHKDTSIHLDHASKSLVSFINEARIYADYSNIKVIKSNKIYLKADFSSSQFTDIKDLDINTEYGDLKIKQIGKLSGSSDFVSLRINELHHSLDLRTDYGSLEIKKLAQSFKELRLRSDFTGINISYDPNIAFLFDIDTEFAGINLSKDLHIDHSEKDYTDKRLIGYAIDRNATSNINIRTSYGGVTLKSNSL